jgi:hypothetical protein
LGTPFLVAAATLLNQTRKLPADFYVQCNMTVEADAVGAKRILDSDFAGELSVAIL